LVQVAQPKPLPQPGAPQAGAGELPVEVAAKTDSIFEVLVELQRGQGTVVRVAWINSSNFSPQASHLYSNIGIV